MIQLVAVDLQYDFTRRGGKHYNPYRKSIKFIRRTLIPYLKSRKMMIKEIVSDYRQPRNADKDECCLPGTRGYASELPSEIVFTQYVKSENSPLYVRPWAGYSAYEPELPHGDVEAFGVFMRRGTADVKPNNCVVVLFGLTLDCCVLCTAQAANFMGYQVRILREAVDTYSGDGDNCEKVMNSVLHNWAEWICWHDLKASLEME